MQYEQKRVNLCLGPRDRDQDNDKFDMINCLRNCMNGVRAQQAVRVGSCCTPCRTTPCRVLQLQHSSSDTKIIRWSPPKQAVADAVNLHLLSQLFPFQVPKILQLIYVGKQSCDSSSHRQKKIDFGGTALEWCFLESELGRSWSTSEVRFTVWIARRLVQSPWLSFTYQVYIFVAVDERNEDDTYVPDNIYLSTQRKTENNEQRGEGQHADPAERGLAFVQCCWHDKGQGWGASVSVYIKRDAREVPN